MAAYLYLGARPAAASRDSGSFRGTISTWRAPVLYSQAGESAERSVIQRRAADLYVNDWAARSVINTISTNVVGSGLNVKARLPWRRLGITREQARQIGSAMEWLWYEWALNCHSKGKMSFGDLQLAGFRSILKNGEMLHIPVMLKDRKRKFALAIQDLSPSRLCTPVDRETDLNIRDGVEITGEGRVTAYWIATPPQSLMAMDMACLGSENYTRVPARLGHRPNAFHLFFPEDEESARGVSILSAAIKLFRHLSDSITHELFGQVASASFPLVVETGQENASLPDFVREETLVNRDGQEEKIYYENAQPGTILYLNENEHIKAVESSRPSPNFLSFCELVIRALAASADMPYEAVMKDFSKTNYSSARAALLEAWRTYSMRRAWFAANYCQPIYNMVIEEAFLRGYLELPAGAPDFYDAMYLWTNADWIGPAKGYVDPTKEVEANIKAHDARFKSRSEIAQEQGRDLEDLIDELEEEEAILAELNQTRTSAPEPPANQEKENEKAFGI